MSCTVATMRDATLEYTVKVNPTNIQQITVKVNKLGWRLIKFFSVGMIFRVPTGIFLVGESRPYFPNILFLEFKVNCFIGLVMVGLVWSFTRGPVWRLLIRCPVRCSKGFCLGTNPLCQRKLWEHFNQIVYLYANVIKIFSWVAFPKCTQLQASFDEVATWGVRI